MALAQCLRALPLMPFGPMTTDHLADLIRNLWAAYENVSGRLSAFCETQDAVHRAVLRHATVEIAIRAGVVACICGDKSFEDEIPLWFKNAELKKRLRDLLKLAFRTRDQAAIELNRAPSEIDRWLDDLDVPGGGEIKSWEEAMLKAPREFKRFGARPLWRLYVGRRLWKCVSLTVPDDLREDLLKAYSRIRNRINAHLTLERRGTDDERQQHLASLVTTGRITDPLLLAQLLAGETDAIWRRHIEAFVHVNGMAPNKVVSICETYANAAAGMTEGARCFGVKPPFKLDDFVRRYLLLAENGNSPLGRTAKLVEQAMRYESDGDHANVGACLEELVRIAPTAARWHSLGRTRLKLSRLEETEKCYREALKLAPDSLDFRADMALLLANSKRAELALEELDKCSDEDKTRPVWKFVRGKALLVLARGGEAKEILLECLKAKFKVAVCYSWLARACELLGQCEEAREYRKRATELEAG